MQQQLAQIGNCQFYGRYKEKLTLKKYGVFLIPIPTIFTPPAHSVSKKNNLISDIID